MPLDNTIFKYLDCTGTPILADSELRISNPSKLNDPFEAIPWIKPPSTEDILNKLSEPGILEVATPLLLQRHEIAHPSEAETYLKTNMVDFANRLYAESRQKPSLADPLHLREEIAELFGFTSFSATPVDILMWSHYADKHKGFVLGFSPRIFGEEYPREVIYSSHRIEYSPFLNSATRDYLFFKILRTKSLHWAYERELRSVLPWSACHKKDDGFFYHSFLATDLKCLIFGSKCTPDTKNRLVKEIETKYPHAEIYETSINPYRYELDLYELVRKKTSAEKPSHF